MRIGRWCTHKFKIRPLRKYFQRPSIVYIGIDVGEAHRAREYSQDGLEYQYPLVEAGIDRKRCEEIILAHRLVLPKKSGCFICPFQGRRQWRNLRDNYPDLWCKAKRLEDIVVKRLAEAGKEPIYMAADMPLDRAVNEDQLDFFGWRKPCNCEVE